MLAAQQNIPHKEVNSALGSASGLGASTLQPHVFRGIRGKEEAGMPFAQADR
jgi:hypothetical protein